MGGWATCPTCGLTERMVLFPTRLATARELPSRWVLPYWGKLELRAIKSVAVERWLKTLMTSEFGKPKPCAGGTKEKICAAMSSIFNHAIEVGAH